MQCRLLFGISPLLELVTSRTENVLGFRSLISLHTKAQQRNKQLARWMTLLNGIMRQRTCTVTDKFALSATLLTATTLRSHYMRVVRVGLSQRRLVFNQAALL